MNGKCRRNGFTEPATGLLTPDSAADVGLLVASALAPGTFASSLSTSRCRGPGNRHRPLSRTALPADREVRGRTLRGIAAALSADDAGDSAAMPAQRRVSSNADRRCRAIQLGLAVQRPLPARSRRGNGSRFAPTGRLEVHGDWPGRLGGRRPGERPVAGRPNRGRGADRRAPGPCRQGSASRTCWNAAGYGRRMRTPAPSRDHRRCGRSWLPAGSSAVSAARAMWSTCWPISRSAGGRMARPGDGLAGAGPRCVPVALVVRRHGPLASHDAAAGGRHVGRPAGVRVRRGDPLGGANRQRRPGSPVPWTSLGREGRRHALAYVRPEPFSMPRRVHRTCPSRR